MYNWHIKGPCVGRINSLKFEKMWVHFNSEIFVAITVITAIKLPNTLDWKTVWIFAYSSTREQSNKGLDQDWKQREGYRDKLSISCQVMSTPSHSWCSLQLWWFPKAFAVNSGWWSPRFARIRIGICSKIKSEGSFGEAT